MDQAVEPVTVTTAPAGDAKVFAAGKAAIAKVDTIDKLRDVTARMEARRADLSDEQYEQLLQLALDRETTLTPAADPFADD